MNSLLKKICDSLQGERDKLAKQAKRQVSVLGNLNGQIVGLDLALCLIHREIASMPTPRKENPHAE